MDPKPSSTPPPVPSGGDSPRADGDPLIGSVLLNRVRIVRPLARGGMGKVYFGEQTGLNRPCAVKVLDPRLAAADAGDFTRRFLLEASVASKLTHPNVVKIFDYGETADGNCFIAMEYLDGRTLADELKTGPLSPERAVHIARQVCRALREAHSLAVVHRDVKPGNVFLIRRDEDGDFVKVLDFGLVGEVQTQEAHDAQGPMPIMGSPKYMAPEQVQGKAADARTDVYAVGAMLYAMLAGRPPFERATDLATMMAQVSDAPPRFASSAPGLHLPAGLEGLVMKCLAKDPDQRYSGMDELIAALKLLPDGSLAASESGPRAMPLLTAPRAATVALTPHSVPSSGRRVAPVAVAAVCAAIIAGVVGASELRRRLSPSGGSPSLAPTSASARAPSPSPAAPELSATLHIETVPPGAKVKEEGETLCEATPCDVVFKGEGATPAFEHLLVFMKADYKLERKLVKVDASPLRVKLTKASAK